MSGFMNIIHAIGVDPRAWIVLALFAARAVWTVVVFARCPMRAGDFEASSLGPALSGRVLSWRFIATMVLGIILAVAGLFRLNHGAAQPAFALFLLLLGVYLFTTEPVRRQIAMAEKRVRETTDTPGEASAIANLREAHMKLVAFELTIVGVLLVGMLTL
jgi:hypothetical protein